MKLAARIAFAAFLTACALELALRLAPAPGLAASWEYDPVLGHRGPRNRVVPLLSGVPAGAQFNEFGFRGEDPTPRAARPDQFSVFVLGDSITEALQLPWRRAYARRLEALLSERLGRDAEVTNWAASDYGTANEVLAYATVAKPLRPNVVLLQFLGLNDFVNNGLAFAERNSSRSDFVRPYWVPSSRRGQLPEWSPLGADFPVTYPQPVWKWWREHFRLAAYADSFWRRARQKTEANRDPCPVESQVFLDQPDERWQEAWEATRAWARMLRKQVNETAGPQDSPPRLLAFYVPSYFEVSDEAWNHGIALALSRCVTEKFHRENPERRFLEAFQSAGIESVSLLKDLRDSHFPPKQLYLPDGHLSSEGHQVVAEALLRYIAPKSRASARQR